MPAERLEKKLGEMKETVGKLKETEGADEEKQGEFEEKQSKKEAEEGEKEVALRQQWNGNVYSSLCLQQWPGSTAVIWREYDSGRGGQHPQVLNFSHHIGPELGPELPRCRLGSSGCPAFECLESSSRHIAVCMSILFGQGSPFD